MICAAGSTGRGNPGRTDTGLLRLLLCSFFQSETAGWEDGGRMDMEDCGWRTVISEIGNRKGGRNDMYLILSLIPDMTLLWVSFFLSIVFWRYVF